MLTSGLLELERGPERARPWEMLMRAAHSFKGAARIVNLQAAVRVAHVMEDCFALAQQGKLRCASRKLICCFRGVDLLLQISKCQRSEYHPLGHRTRRGIARNCWTRCVQL